LISARLPGEAEPKEEKETPMARADAGVGSLPLLSGGGSGRI